jgi:hypothetical protein
MPFGRVEGMMKTKSPGSPHVIIFLETLNEVNDTKDA